MIVRIDREPSTKKSTTGRLYINSEYYCRTLEDIVRPGGEIIRGETAIPAGTYPVILRHEGTTDAAYRIRFPNMHKGMLYLRDIPGFEYVLIHIGNTPADTLGCILVGMKYVEPDQIVGSEIAYKQIYPAISDAILRGETVLIKINNGKV